MQKACTAYAVFAQLSANTLSDRLGVRRLETRSIQLCMAVQYNSFQAAMIEPGRQRLVHARIDRTHPDLILEGGRKFESAEDEQV